MAGRDIRRLRGSEREANARGMLRRWKASGLSQAAFCRRAGISTVTLGRWLREFGDGEGGSRGGFVEVRLGPSTAAAAYDLELASGRHLRIPAGFDASELDRLLAVLGRVAC